MAQDPTRTDVQRTVNLISQGINKTKRYGKAVVTGRPWCSVAGAKNLIRILPCELMSRGEGVYSPAMGQYGHDDRGKWIALENIKRYQEQLDITQDEDKRKELRRLLNEEAKKLNGSEGG